MGALPNGSEGLPSTLLHPLSIRCSVISPTGLLTPFGDDLSARLTPTASCGLLAGVGVFPVHLCLPMAHTLEHTWEAPNEQEIEGAQPPGSPAELGRPWIPQGASPSKGSRVLLAGCTFITRMPFFLPKY